MTLKALAGGVLRHSKRAAVLALALIAAGIVTSFSVEVGPLLRKRAESAATSAMRRRTMPTSARWVNRATQSTAGPLVRYWSAKARTR